MAALLKRILARIAAVCGGLLISMAEALAGAGCHYVSRSGTCN